MFLGLLALLGAGCTNSITNETSVNTTTQKQEMEQTTQHEPSRPSEKDPTETKNGTVLEVSTSVALEKERIEAPTGPVACGSDYACMIAHAKSCDQATLTATLIADGERTVGFSTKTTNAYTINGVKNETCTFTINQIKSVAFMSENERAKAIATGETETSIEETLSQINNFANEHSPFSTCTGAPNDVATYLQQLSQGIGDAHCSTKAEFGSESNSSATTCTFSPNISCIITIQ